MSEQPTLNKQPSQNINLDLDDFVYEYGASKEESEITEQLVSQTGFKRRAIVKDEDHIVNEYSNKALNEDENKNFAISSDLIVNVSESPAYLGVNYPGINEDRLFDIQLIIDEAKKSENLFSKSNQS